MLHQLEKLFNDQVRPALAAHGGNVEIIDVDNDKLFLKFIDFIRFYSIFWFLLCIYLLLKSIITRCTRTIKRMKGAPSLWF